jgi:YVTN family beta-propeller protein
MNQQHLVRQIVAGTILGIPFLLVAAIWAGGGLAAAERKEPAPVETRSSPIAITHSDDFVWSVNPDNDSVSVFAVTQDQNTKVAEITVGDEPWCVALTPDDAKAYVTNMASGTVSVVSVYTKQVIDVIKVGAEPFGCALTPDGRKLYIANQSSDTVSVIDTRHDRVVRTISDVGAKPHGIAIGADGARVFVTQFLALKADDDPRPLTQSEGADDGREGRVTVINGHNDQVVGVIGLAPLADVGAAFKSDGNTRFRLRSRHMLVAKRPLPIQRQRAELSLYDRCRAECRGVHDLEHERGRQLRVGWQEVVQHESVFSGVQAFIRRRLHRTGGYESAASCHAE